MKRKTAKEKIIEGLQIIVTDLAQQADGHQLQSRIFASEGFSKLAEKYAEHAEEERGYVQKCIDRILDLGGEVKLEAKKEGPVYKDPNTPGKLEGDHAGHIAGDRFGGSPEIDNLVSQSKNVNLSKYKTIENQWAKAINEGKKVTVDISIEYEGNSMRPSKFDVKYTIDGQGYKESIMNE